ncbi:MAG: histidine kinase [Spirochaetales bacterium]|nr:histidine kinase [Spirochaetales bacterium]
MAKEKILVVEDEGLVALSLKKCLESLGYDVPATAAASDEVVKKTAEISPDLILMDIRLKGDVDGIELAEWLKQTYKIPVVFLTAHSDQKTLERAKQTAPFGYIVKPFEEKSLHSTIEMALYKARMDSRLSLAQQKLTTILRSIQEAVITSDLKGQIDYSNRAAQKLIGFTGEESDSHNLMTLLKFTDMDTDEEVKLPISAVAFEGKTMTVENLWLERKESQVPVDFTLAPVYSERDVTMGIVLTIRDISMRVRLRDGI